MSDPTSMDAGTVTLLLRSAKSGDRAAYDTLFAVIEPDLRRIAQNLIARSGRTSGLECGTEVVSAACLRLLGRGDVSAENRRHLFFLLGRAMRDVLIEQARAESAAVRGGRAVHCPLLEVADDESSVTVDMEAVAKALTELRSADAETADLVEMRFFGGLSLEQIAESMGWSYATTRRTWDYGKSWLAARLKQA